MKLLSQLRPRIQPLFMCRKFKSESAIMTEDGPAFTLQVTVSIALIYQTCQKEKGVWLKGLSHEIECRVLFNYLKKI